MDIELMTDKEILEFVKGRKASKPITGGIRSKTIEDFFETYNITIRCPHCLSPYKVGNGYN